MHTLLGYSWGEIASILAAISVTISGFYWVVRHLIKKLREFIAAGTLSLRERSKERSRQIEQLSEAVDRGYKEARGLKQEVDEHDKAVLLHGEKIKELEKSDSRQHDVLIKYEARLENLESDKK